MNITEFAKYAEVSKAAVSRYFNNGYLSREKKEQIERAIRETGYSPSESARSIRTHKTRLIGVILPKLSSESTARVAEGISEVLSRDGFQLLLANTANNHEKEVEYLEIFRSGHVDGVIFLASVFTPSHHAILSQMHMPIVIVGQLYKRISSVCHDDAGAACALTSLMLGKGARRPGYIGVTALDESAGRNRYEGYMRALGNHGIRPDPALMSIAEFNMESGYKQAEKLLSQQNPPDCLFCATDNIAIGAMQYCREHSIRIPQDIMVCGVGDTSAGRICAVPLTTAHLHFKSAGRDAAELLLTAIERRESIPRTIQLDFEIIERESTGFVNNKM